MTGKLRKLHTEDIHDPSSSPDTVRVIKSRTMSWTEHVARSGRRQAYTGFWWGNLKERDHLKAPDVDGRIILRWIFRKWYVKLWTGSSVFRKGTGGEHL